MQSGALAVVCLLRHFVHVSLRPNDAQGSGSSRGVDFSQEALLFMGAHVCLLLLHYGYSTLVCPSGTSCPSLSGHY